MLHRRRVAAGSVGRVTNAAPTREDVASVIDFACLVALDPAISATTIRDALVVLGSRESPAAPTIEPLVTLAHVRAEAWRQLRARNIHPDTAPDVRIDAEPLEALTPSERTALYLLTRRGMPPHDAAFVMDRSPKEVRRLRRTASVSFVRAVTALALAMDLTPCPIRDGIAARGAGMLSRKDITALTMHAAECSICVEWLRRADKTALDGYGVLAKPGDLQIDAVLVDAQSVPAPERERVVRRAGALRRDGRPPRESRLDRDPQYFLRRGIGFAVASVIFVLGGLLLLSP